MSSLGTIEQHSSGRERRKEKLMKKVEQGNTRFVHNLCNTRELSTLPPQLVVSSYAADGSRRVCCFGFTLSCARFKELAGKRAVPFHGNYYRVKYLQNKLFSTNLSTFHQNNPRKSLSSNRKYANLERLHRQKHISTSSSHISHNH